MELNGVFSIASHVWGHRRVSMVWRIEHGVGLEAKQHDQNMISLTPLESIGIAPALQPSAGFKLPEGHHWETIGRCGRRRQSGDNWKGKFWEIAGTCERQLEDNWETILRPHLGNIWETTGKQLGDNWETTGRQLGNNIRETHIWETTGRPPEHPLGDIISHQLAISLHLLGRKHPFRSAEWSENSMQNGPPISNWRSGSGTI